MGRKKSTSSRNRKTTIRMPKDRGTPELAERHRLGSKVVDNQTVTYVRTQTLLDRLATRGVINSEQYQAGDHLLQLAVGMRGVWSSPSDFSREKVKGTPAFVTAVEYPEYCRREYRALEKLLPKFCWRVVEMVCVDDAITEDMTLAKVDRKLNNPARSSTMLLRESLEILSRHMGYKR